jgi:guanine deaminase
MGCCWSTRGASPGSVTPVICPVIIKIEDCSGKLILPGFIDCHVHYAQLDIVACDGQDSLDWLDRCAYPEEAKFSDPAYVRKVADAFLDQLLIVSRPAAH